MFFAGSTTAAALATFDSLPAVSVERMLGRWRGEGVPTGHRLDGLLERFGWYGKAFASAEDVQPLLFADAHGAIYPIDPRYVPMQLVARAAGALNHAAIGALFRRVGWLARARSPGARLRMTQYRGLATATMIYDRLPICDVFRLVDDDTVLGLMDLRGEPQPFFFLLRRDPGPRRRV